MRMIRKEGFYLVTKTVHICCPECGGIVPVQTRQILQRVALLLDFIQKTFYRRRAVQTGKSTDYIQEIRESVEERSLQAYAIT